MRTLELGSYGVSEISNNEMLEVDGGRKLPTWDQVKKAWSYIDKAITWAGIYDAFNDAIEGFNEGAGPSGQCCK
ncbi:hypothetical protein [Runella sp.]|jgi:hypothetical protein|uniref:hypothetical protein n=1 Tax=Runella sp. TaxID=1960881 RepID=UPI0030186E3B